jgi:5'-methylthioadenosine phosphorylase
LTHRLRSYALIATATDYDSWRPHTDNVTVADVLKILQDNADTSRFAAATVLAKLVSDPDLHNLISEQTGSMKYSIMPRTDAQTEDDKKKLAYILPEYFAE